MAESNGWILKIISGPHQGAEVALPPGRVVVGADPECDLVLHDVLVAPQHFALSLAHNTATLEPLEGRVYANGRRAATATPVPAFGFVTAGTTHLVVGPAHARWPLLSPADVPELEKDPPPTPEPGGVTVDAPTAAGASATTRPEPTPHQRRRALWTAAMGGALLLVWLALWLTWTSQGEAEPAPSARERAEQVLGAFPEARTIRLERQGDQLVATGYLASNSALHEISAALRQEVPEVVVQVWSTPRLLETVRSFLAGQQLELEPVALDRGELHLRGAMPSREAWAAVRQSLLAEVPGVQRIREELTFPPPPAAAPAPADGPAEDNGLPAPLRQVSVVALHDLGDGQGWIRLSDGAVLFRGGRLPGLGRITAVHPDGATAENGPKRFLLRVGADLATAWAGAVTVEPDASLSPVVAEMAITKTGEKTGRTVQPD